MWVRVAWREWSGAGYQGPETSSCGEAAAFAWRQWGAIASLIRVVVLPSDCLVGRRVEAMRWEGTDLAARPRVMERRAWL